MEYIISHHGVKGMKWGVRKSKPASKRRRPMSQRERELSKEYREKYSISKKKSDVYARRNTENLKKVAIGVGAVAAIGIGYYAYSSYGRLVADNIIRKGSTIQTLHHHPELITEGKKFYTTAKRFDKLKYMADFSKNHEGVKKKITAEVGSNLKIAGIKTGRETFKTLQSTNPDFYKATKGINYDTFNRHRLIGEPSAEVTTFINTLKSKGYNGVADVNDRRGWKTMATIMFDNTNLQNIKVNDLSQKEIMKAKAVVYSSVTLKEIAQQPATWIIGAGAGASAISTLNDKRTELEIRKDLKNASKNPKKNTTKRS